MELFHKLLDLLRKIYAKVSGLPSGCFSPSEIAATSEEASIWIRDAINSGNPFMIARYGSYELETVLNVQKIVDGGHDYLKYVTGKSPACWWKENLRFAMQNNTGFFPTTNEMLIRYKDRMLEDTRQLNLLGDFCRSVRFIENEIKGVKRVHLKDLEPFYGTIPWTSALKGKRVLVVHPLADLILKQYKEHRADLFKNPELLPEFHLETIPAVQSLGEGSSKFENWFDALKWMEDEIDKHEYDVCLIGCGAYGFCLAAHCKRMGKVGIHLGGIVQLLFGIRGKRWDDPMYGVKEWGIPIGMYSSLVNEYWIRPSDTDKPKNAHNVEGACYW